MKLSISVVVFSTLLAIIYGVTFSITYPLVELTGSIFALCALCGLVTCLTAMSLWKVVMGANRA